MSRNKRWIAVVALGALSLAACGGTSSTGEASDRVSLRVTTPIGGPDGLYNAPVVEYLDAVSKSTNGAVEHEFFYEGSLAAGDEIPSALESGVADMAVMVTSFTPADFPVDTWVSQLAFEGDLGVPALVMQRSAAILDWWYSHEEIMEAEFGAKNIKALTPGVAPSPSYHLLCTEPVTTLEEARGKQVRTPGPAWAAEADAFGMTAVSIPGYEMYEAMQRGVVDCGMTDAPDIVSSGFWDVGKHYTSVGLTGFTSMGLFFNQDSWEAMSPEIQEAFVDNLPIYFAGLAERSVATQHQFVSEGADKDVEFYTAGTDMENALASHRDELLSDLTANPPTSVSDPRGVIADYQDSHDRWATIITDELGYPDATTWTDWVDENSGELDFDATPWAERVVEEIYRD